MDEWDAFRERNRQSKLKESYVPTWLQNGREEKIFREPQTEDDQPLVASEWYIISNTGCGDSLGTDTSRAKMKTKRFASSRSLPSPNEGKKHRNLSTKQEVKENALREELRILEQTLRSRATKLGDMHINGCISLYRQISRCMEVAKCKKNKKKVSAAATYYTLKRYFNPTIVEIEQIFDMDHKSVTDALKRMRTLAFRNPSEFGWLFQQERGETNLFRSVSEHGLPWSTTQKCIAFAKDKELDLRDDSVVNNLIKRFSKQDEPE